ncbi:hypothetical protein HU200_024103 [Digitaria exilis]|uniref:Uncharacterized protein n=1 Tax=Digitaria exilis TaxID=1010633 RepID=A0A835C9W1_9POAL|nr:hypothetical protein HU200_024103 [Digitaria exilis]
MTLSLLSPPGRNFWHRVRTVGPRSTSPVLVAPITKWSMQSAIPANDHLTFCVRFFRVQRQINPFSKHTDFDPAILHKPCALPLHVPAGHGPQRFFFVPLLGQPPLISPQRIKATQAKAIPTRPHARPSSPISLYKSNGGTPPGSSSIRPEVTLQAFAEPARALARTSYAPRARCQRPNAMERKKGRDQRSMEALARRRLSAREEEVLGLLAGFPDGDSNRELSFSDLVRPGAEQQEDDLGNAPAAAALSSSSPRRNEAPAASKQHAARQRARRTGGGNRGSCGGSGDGVLLNFYVPGLLTRSMTAPRPGRGALLSPGAGQGAPAKATATAAKATRSVSDRRPRGYG